MLEGSPLAPRNVSQRIDVAGRRCVNAVSLAPWPPAAVSQVLGELPGPLGSALSGALSALQESLVTATPAACHERALLKGGEAC